jgi:hypothetical protein
MIRPFKSHRFADSSSSANACPGRRHPRHAGIEFHSIDFEPQRMLVRFSNVDLQSRAADILRDELVMNTWWP